MNTGMFFIFDWWGQWAVDRAGEEVGHYGVRELRAMLDRYEIEPRTWLRHVWTGRYSLVGEVLYGNKLATDEEYESWFPTPKAVRPMAPIS
jgi:hypothetical protein